MSLTDPRFYMQVHLRNDLLIDDMHLIFARALLVLVSDLLVLVTALLVLVSALLVLASAC